MVGCTDSERNAENANRSMETAVEAALSPLHTNAKYAQSHRASELEANVDNPPTLVQRTE